MGPDFLAKDRYFSEGKATFDQYQLFSIGPRTLHVFMSRRAFSIYKKIQKISIWNFRLERTRSICHKSHSFTGPSLSLYQTTKMP